MQKTLTVVNMICILWNFITLFAVKIDLNQCLMLWLFNISNLVMPIERHCPEIKNRTAKIVLYSLICGGHLFSIIILIAYQCEPALIFCFLFNVINCIASTVFFVVVVDLLFGWKRM